MRSERKTHTSKWTLAGIAVVGTLVAAPSLGAARADLEATVTSVHGDVSSGDAPLTANETVAGGQQIQTGPDASCSVLVDRTAVVQFCGRSLLRFREAEPGSATRILEVSEGSTRATVGARPLDAPLEIHTPAAVAVILGTVISVNVNPETGETTFVLEEGSVRIQSETGASVTLEAGQKLTVRPGQALEAPQQLALADLAPVAACLDDRLFRAAALDVARIEREQTVARAVAEQDARDEVLPPVASDDDPWDPPRPEPPGNLCDDPTLCNDTDVMEMLMEMMPPVVPAPMPPPCDGIPGEQCIF